MKFTELNEAQRKDFTGFFYWYWRLHFPEMPYDLDSPLPWGCPWLWSDASLKSIDGSASNLGMEALLFLMDNTIELSEIYTRYLEMKDKGETK